MLNYTTLDCDVPLPNDRTEADNTRLSDFEKRVSEIVARGGKLLPLLIVPIVMDNHTIGLLYVQPVYNPSGIL